MALHNVAHANLPGELREKVERYEHLSKEELLRWHRILAKQGWVAPAWPVLVPPGMWALARKILLHDRVKFAVAGAGVSISVLLVLVQIGLYFGFMENASTLIDHGKADLWVTAQGNENFDFAAPMDERLYYRVAETPGVARAERMILAFGQFKLPDDGTQGVQVVGLDDGARLLRP